MFTPTRLTLARKKRGMTKKELAESVGLKSPQSITNFESEKHPDTPCINTLNKISQVLEFPVDFFKAPKVNFISPDSASFRALSKMTSAERDIALTSGEMAFFLNDWIEERFNLPAHNLPDFRNETPESAAVKLRQQWLLGEKPISNLIHLLESKGIKVYSIEVDSLNVDAFSIWNNGVPFVMLNNAKSAERSRFDAAHELGHLILHKHGINKSRIAEQQANDFASSFLMPEASIKAETPQIPTFNALIKIKHKWLVSLPALVYRLKKLDLITEWQHRTLVIEMSKRGYNKKELYPIPKETSQVLSKVFAELKKDNISKAQVASEIFISKNELEKLIFGMIAIQGGNQGEAEVSKANLKLI